MSRQRLRGTVTPPVSILEDFSDSDSDNHVQSTSTALQTFSTTANTGYQHTSVYETDQLDFSDDVDNSVSRTPNRVKQKRHMDLDNLQKQQSGSGRKNMEGMVLRSGSHLKTSKHSRDTLSVKGSDSADGIHRSSKSPSPSHGKTAAITKTVTRTVTEIEELEEELNQNNSANARKSTRSPSPSTNRSYRNDSGQNKDYRRYSDQRKRYDKYQQEKSHHVKHMYGLDRTDEFSDSDSGTYSSSSSSGSVVNASYNRSSKMKKGRAEDYWLVSAMQKFYSSIYILFETLMLAFWRVLAPSVRLYSKSFQNVWKIVTKMSRYFIIMDAWILGRAPRKGICLCLPLIILLPLMLLAGGPFLLRAQGFRDSLFGMPFLFSSSHVNQMKGDTSNTLNFHHEVRQVLNQILMEKREWLTRVEAEQLVKRLLGPEIEHLRVGLLNVANEGKTEQSSIRIDQNDAKVKLMTLEGQMAKLDTNVKNFEETLAESRKQFSSSLSSNREQQANEMSVIEQALVSMRSQLDSLQSSFAAIIAQKKKCCLDDATLASAVRDHVNVIVAELFQDGGKGSSGAAFAGWLNQNYVDRTEFERQLRILTVDITSKISSGIDAQRNSHSSSFFLPTAAGTLGEDAVRLIVEDALLKYSADRTGLPDYALESAGGSVLSTRCSETYYKKTALISIFGIPLWYMSNSPRTVIQPDVYPGQCWAFKGDSGYIVIQLSVPIRPTGFSLEHIPKSLSPNGSIDSAPRDFTVYGLNSDSDMEGVNLGNFTYVTVGKPIQSFDVQVRNPGVFGYVELRVLNNHGNKDYTCLYRFRVHGVPQT